MSLTALPRPYAPFSGQLCHSWASRPILVPYDQLPHSLPSHFCATLPQSPPSPGPRLHSPSLHTRYYSVGPLPAPFPAIM